MTKVIKVENLSKAYQIGEFSTGTLSRDIERWWALSRGKEDPFLKIGETNVRSEKGESNIVWSLKDLNFEIEQGEAIGIIGKNGAGKSTLLKVLSQVTTPTTGTIKMKGRVASLLEVGTGFHPELTGRENIYLNGAILGMQKAEVSRKFDEIVDFSGVERYIDTPVKRYSSGMYVRLAFAVAAHLDSEILIVDEVLAVGDAEFQKKCIGKMGKITEGEGRTILFVSHNMNSVVQLCSRGILLQDGAVKYADEDVSSVIHKYFETGMEALHSWTNENDNFQNEYFKPLSLKVVDSNLVESKMPLASDAENYIQIEAEIKTLHSALTIGYCLYTEDGQQLYWSYQTDASQSEWPVLRTGQNILLCEIPKRLLREGNYRIEIIGGLHFIKWILEPRRNNPSIMLKIRGGISDSPFSVHNRPTLISPVLEWKNLK